MHFASFRIPALLTITLCFIGLSCSKDKYTTKPQLTIELLNTLIPAPGGTLNVMLQYTSKKGNLGGGYFIALRKRLNQDFIAIHNTDTFSGLIPAFPAQSKAEFKFTADWQSLYDSPPTNSTEPDTIVFKFAAMDADSNFSDTITSPKIIVLGQ